MSQRRFTLVELMIVVAIIGILAAIAIPNFASMQIKARFSEVFVNMDGVDAATRAALATEALQTSPVIFTNEHPRPPADVDKTAVPWGVVTGNWTLAPYEPDGAVRCSYSWTTLDPYPFVSVEGWCDVDDDGLAQNLHLNRSIVTTLVVEGQLSGKAQGGCTFDGRENLSDCPVY